MTQTSLADDGQPLVEWKEWFKQIARGIGPGRALLEGMREVAPHWGLTRDHHLYHDACDHARDRCLDCHGPKHPEAVNTWFRTVGRNRMRNYLRGRERVEHPREAPVEVSPSRKDDPRKALENHETYRFVEEGLSDKADDTRFAFIATCFLGFSRREVADQLDLACHQIDYRLRKARRNLREAYEEMTAQQGRDE